jgi:hypothetical protein
LTTLVRRENAAAEPEAFVASIRTRSRRPTSLEVIL